MKQVAFFLAASFAGLAAHAQSNYAPSDAELASMPAICKIKLRPSPEQRSYAERYGANWEHMHHYCFGVVFANRAASARDSTARNTNFKESIANYQYMIDHTDRAFWMRPQIRVEMGRVYLRMNNKIEAAKEFSAALMENPRYELAYVQLVGAYRSLGNSAGALETATAGLRYFPNSTVLQEAYLASGGKKPFPAPATSASDNASEARAGREVPAADMEPKPSSDVSESSITDPNKGTASGYAEDIDGRQVLESGCRFCPPEEIQRKWRESFGEQPKH